MEVLHVLLIQDWNVVGCEEPGKRHHKLGHLRLQLGPDTGTHAGHASAPGKHDAQHGTH